MKKQRAFQVKLKFTFEIVADLTFALIQVSSYPLKQGEFMHLLWMRLWIFFVSMIEMTDFRLFVSQSFFFAMNIFRWDVLRPTKLFGEGALLPLMDILAHNNHIKKLVFSSTGMIDYRFRSSGNGNSNARILSKILSQNTTIESVDLSHTGVDDDGMVELCHGIQFNTTITDLNLSSNHFGELGASRLKQALENNTSLQRLDLSRNALGYSAINNIVCACSTKNILMQTHGNFVLEEILNSVSHGIAFIASVVGANLLISASLTTKQSTEYHFWSCVLYSFALMFLFLSSSLFHSFFMIPHGERVFVLREISVVTDIFFCVFCLFFIFYLFLF